MPSFTKVQTNFIDSNNFGSGIGSIIEDTTPQLGGTLDINGNPISAGTNTLTVSGTNNVLVSLDRSDNKGPTLRFRNGGSGSNYEAWINLWGSTGGGTNRTNMLEFNASNMDSMQWNVKEEGTFYWSCGDPGSGNRELELTNAALYPTVNNGLNLGSSSKRWNSIYGTTFDGTTFSATTFTDTTYDLTGTDIDPANGGIQSKTFSGNTTFTESLSAGNSVVLHLEAGSSHTIGWPTIKWVTSGGNTAPTLTAKDVVVLWKIGTTLYGAYAGSYV